RLFFLHDNKVYVPKPLHLLSNICLFGWNVQGVSLVRVFTNHLPDLVREDTNQGKHTTAGSKLSSHFSLFTSHFSLLTFHFSLYFMSPDCPSGGQCAANIPGANNCDFH